MKMLVIKENYSAFMKQRPVVSDAITLLAITLALLPVMETAHAQIVARVAAREHITEKRNNATAPWFKASVGTTLEQDNRFRTRKRSKADILFVDKSLIRLGALSTLWVQSVTDAKLEAGQLLFSRITPGRIGHIVAGAGTAGIKGSVGLIQLFDDGSALFTLIDGAMDVTTIRGEQISLLPGQAVLVSADGALSALRVAAPLISGGSGNLGPGTGGGGSGLGQAPVDSPFAGSSVNLNIRSSPERLAADQGNTASNPVVAQNANPFPVGGGLPAAPPIAVFPARLRLPVQGRQITRLAAVDGTPATGGNPIGALPDVTSAVGGLNSNPAQDHIWDAMNGSRGTGITDIEMIGALGDGGTLAYGGRFHTYLNKGPWSLDVALLPLKLRYNGPAGRTTRDLSALSSAALTYSGPRAEVEIGRQRFLGGPTQAALFGSMVRQGARDTMDAVRISPYIGKKRRLDLAYIYDAFPRNLPYRVPGAQKGLYGRFSMQTPRGNYGLNLLHYNNLTVSTTTGASVDLAVPVIPNQVEVYGELGRDPFRRGMVTVGVTFPGLYDRTDFDVYLESASLRRWGGTAPIPPTEYSLRVYRRLNKNSNLVVQLQKFYRSQSSVTVGFSYGAHILLPRS